MSPNTEATAAFRAARDHLLSLRTDYAAAKDAFAWPELTRFNWTVDWFDVVAAEPGPYGADAKALWIVEEDGSEAILTFAELSARSNRLATWLRNAGVRRGDRVILMLGNQVELWETELALAKLGAVIIPSPLLVGTADLADRLCRGAARHVITRDVDTDRFAELAGDYTRIAVGTVVEGWEHYPDTSTGRAEFSPEADTHAGDPLLLYFTSGTTAKPKLVENTHTSYPVGALTSMYWIGLQPGDVHLNLASPGWAAQAGCGLFAPWSAQACVLVHNYARFDAMALLRVMQRAGADTILAPPTVWRMLVQTHLAAWPLPLREAVSAGRGPATVRFRRRGQLPENLDVVTADLPVRGDEGVVLQRGLGHQEPVERVAVEPREHLDVGSVPRRHRHRVEVHSGQRPRPPVLDLQLPTRPLDRDLPERHRAHRHGVALVREGIRGDLGDGVALAEQEPHGDVGVEQQPPHA